jgi:hypothetical protein
MIKYNLLLIGLVLTYIFGSQLVYSKETKYKTYTDIGYIEKADLTIEQVISDRNKFHREVITVDGEISKIEYKKLFTGRKFTLFKLEDDKQNTINVYARGYVKDIKKGSEARIYGRYSKEKSFLFKKHKNIMKARKIHILNAEQA